MQRREMLGLITFFSLAFGLPWFGWWQIKDPTLSLWFFPLCCSMAGFIAVFVEGGTPALKVFCQRTMRVSGAMKWTLLAMMIPLLLGVVHLSLKGIPWSSWHFSITAVLGLSLAAALVTGPLAEEFGWRGYLQPKILQHFRPIWAVLILATLWTLWHFPLYENSVFSDLRTTLRFFSYLLTWSIFMMFLVCRANGSVWPAVAFHWLANTHADILRVLLPGLDGSYLPGGSQSTWLYLAAGLLFVCWHWRFFSKPTPTV